MAIRWVAPVISMSALDTALEVFDKVDLLEVRQKTIRLTDLFITLAAQTPALDSLSLASPTDADQRGAQLAWRHANAYAIWQRPTGPDSCSAAKADLAVFQANCLSTPSRLSIR